MLSQRDVAEGRFGDAHYCCFRVTNGSTRVWPALPAPPARRSLGAGDAALDRSGPHAMGEAYCANIGPQMVRHAT